MCLLSTVSARYTCACPDGLGLRLAANQRTCINAGSPVTPPPVPQVITTAPPPALRCVPACQNGGTCVGSTCRCALGWTGSYCQTGNNCYALILQLWQRVHIIVLSNHPAVCSPSCRNGGTCTAGVCRCTNEWEGEQCQKRETLTLMPVATTRAGTVSANISQDQDQIIVQ